METTRRRLASIMACLARMSPRSMRLASMHFLLGRQQRDAADGAQVQAQRVERGLDGEVELRPLLGGRRVRRGIAGALEHVDAVIEEIRVQVFDLLLRDLDLFEHGRDLFVR